MPKIFAKSNYAQDIFKTEIKTIKNIKICFKIEIIENFLVKGFSSRKFIFILKTISTKPNLYYNFLYIIIFLL